MHNRTMMDVLYRLGVVITLTLASAIPVSAQIINGSFEADPPFTAWSTVGDASLQTSSYGVAPSDGVRTALISTDATGISSNGSVSASTVSTFLNLTPGSLTGARGSAFKQTFTATAGQIITFDWDFLTNQKDPTLNNSQNHYAFYTLNGVRTNLADVITGAFVSSNATDFLDETGYHTLGFTIPSSGAYTLGFGVMNSNTNDVASGLIVDHVQIRTLAVTPEPGSLALLAGVGAAALTRLRRRRRK